jgi:hypothetical protein
MKLDLYASKVAKIKSKWIKELNTWNYETTRRKHRVTITGHWNGQ